ncbi:MAG: amidophosphoribosyltransferase [bacterium]|nr:amidophosphoribosyltransferase [bacterium]
MKEECGVFGIFNHLDASQMVYLGLYSLQHRGQESAGIAVSNRDRICNFRRMGLVSDIFKPKVIKKLTGSIAIGHVRYSTSGFSIERNAQPFSVFYDKGPIAVSHNGNISNAFKVRQDLEKEGAIFQTMLDSEIIVHLLAKQQGNDLAQNLINSLNQLQGAYSFLVMTEDKLIAARDPWGFRPLCLGKLGGSYVVSSETCAFDLIGAKYLREVEPGELVVISDEGLKSYDINKAEKSQYCIFEHIYFARPDSVVFGKSVQAVRKKLGRELAKEFPADVDIVIPVPDSGNYAAYGYAEQSGIPFEMGFVRNHYVGRTFIKPNQSDRSFAVKVKLNPVKDIIKGKRIVVVDDSIVRATTSKLRVDALREAGAKEVHLRISAPPITNSCFFGIDTPEKNRLIAANNTVEEIQAFLGVDSLGYISIEGLNLAVGDVDKFCLACFTGEYPLPVEEDKDKLHLENTTQIDFDF